MGIKDCSTCKFANVFPFNEPCRTCCRETSESEEGVEVYYTNWEPRPDKGENRRPKILPMVKPYYERNSSRIPEQIRVSFSDGSTEVYDLRVDQPAPQIVESIKIIRRMKQGYVNQPRRRRNRK